MKSCFFVSVFFFFNEKQMLFVDALPLVNISSPSSYFTTPNHGLGINKTQTIPVEESAVSAAFWWSSHHTLSVLQWAVTEPNQDLTETQLGEVREIKRGKEIRGNERGYSPALWVCVDQQDKWKNKHRSAWTGARETWAQTQTEWFRSVQQKLGRGFSYYIYIYIYI